MAPIAAPAAPPIPVLSAVFTPCDGPSTPLEEPEICMSLPCAVSPTKANSTCDLPEILPLLSILMTFNCALDPRCTTTLPSLVSGVTTVAGSNSPTVELSELKSLSRRTATDPPEATEDNFACGEGPAFCPGSGLACPDGGLFCPVCGFCTFGAGGFGF